MRLVPWSGGAGVLRGCAHVFYGPAPYIIQEERASSVAGAVLRMLKV